MNHPILDANPQPAPLVLIVDDEKTLRLILSQAMQKEGYQTLTASSGEEALSLCQQQRPEIILLDAMMAGMDGFTCCAQLQTQLGTDCPPILMITSLYDADSVDRAFAVGAIDFVTKPIHWSVLRQRVQRLIQTNRTLAELRSRLAEEQALRLQLETLEQKLKQLTCGVEQ